MNKAEFKQKYPNVNIDNFVFRNIYTDRTRTKVDRVDVFYRVNGRMLNIERSSFKRDYGWVFVWGQRIWNVIATCSAKL